MTQGIPFSYNIIPILSCMVNEYAIRQIRISECPPRIQMTRSALRPNCN